MTDIKIQHGVIVRPGDTLVLSLDRYMSDEEMAQFDSGLAEVMPGVKVAFLEGIKEMAVYRPEPEMPGTVV